MSDRTSIIMNTTSTEDKESKRSITDISPSATDSEIIAFANGLNNLTTNTLKGLSKVDTTNLTINPTQRTISFDANPITTVTLSDIKSSSINSGGLFDYLKQTITGQEAGYQINGTPYVKSNETRWPVDVRYMEDDNGDYYWTIWINASDYNPFEKTPTTGKIVFAVDQSDELSSAEVTLTITEG